jgi:hypothetical protein
MSKARDLASAAPAPAGVTSTELGYVDGVTSAIQTQLDAKTAKSTLTTTGDIYYASAANTPARLGIGTAAQLLAVNSGATAPEWVAAPAAGGMTLLDTVTASGGTASFTSIPSGYKNLLIVFKNIVCATYDVVFYLRLNSDSGSNYSYNCIGNSSGTPSSIEAISANYQWMSLTTNQSTDRFAYSGSLNIYRYAEAEGHHMDGFARANTETQPYAGVLRGFHSTGAAVTTVTFGSVSGNMSSGTAYLYGVK